MALLAFDPSQRLERTEPVAARQREQWQFTAYTNSAATSYCTRPPWPSPVRTPSGRLILSNRQW